MTFDEETLMAFADGELDPIAAKRVERAIATDTILADRVAAHRLVRRTLIVAYPLDRQPDPLADVIRAHTVVPMPVKSPLKQGWLKIAAVAACVVVGVGVGTQWQNDSVRSPDGTLVASRSLAGALDTQLASASGDTHILVSFRNRSGNYCRVFTGEALDGIACKDAGAWKLVRTGSGSTQPGGAYRQAGSENGKLMKEAQDLMVDDPLSTAEEQRARAAKWNSK
ncbi:MAG: anti-sigma factor [Sphingomonadales bacterium]|nr:anti-sigma factor [Sphingomonadales bacterium]